MTDAFSRHLTPHVPFGILIQTVRTVLVGPGMAASRAMAYAGAIAPRPLADVVQAGRALTRRSRSCGTRPRTGIVPTAPERLSSSGGISKRKLASRTLRSRIPKTTSAICPSAPVDG
jgi:hypothetical protein